MGLKKLAAKVAEYNARLEDGRADRIRPDHVERVLEKLRGKSAELQAEIASAGPGQRRARLERKLEVAKVHLARAEWLLREIAKDG